MASAQLADAIPTPPSSRHSHRDSAWSADKSSSGLKTPSSAGTSSTRLTPIKAGAPEHRGALDGFEIRSVHNRPDAVDGHANRSPSQRHRKNPSGGFLLQPLFQHGQTPPKRHATARTPAGSERSKQKARNMDEESPAPSTSQSPPTSQQSRSQASDKSTGDAQYESVQPPSRGSVGSSAISTPLNNRSTSSSHNAPNRRSSQRSSRGPTVDPMQLVQMALNLSESRRLQMDPGTLPSHMNAPGRRTVSTSLASHTPRNAERGQSMRQALEQQRRASRSVTPERSPVMLQGSFLQNSPQQPASSPLPQPEGDIRFSQATLRRAEQARTYFELSYEYRRLLHYLPPLKPTQTSGGHLLGRPYNPLQYLRNRRMRARERRLLDSETDGWHEVGSVKGWVDEVESRAQRADYYSGDIARLPAKPLYHSSKQDHPGQNNNAPEPTAVIPSEHKTQRGAQNWVMEPSDLLADAYWLEQDSHKTLLEGKDGHPLFNVFQRPRRIVSQESLSNEIAQRAKQSTEVSSPDNALTSISSWSPQDPDMEIYTRPFKQVGRQAGKHVHIRSPIGRVRHRLFRRHRREPASDESLSSSDVEKLGRLDTYAYQTEIGDNTGPLQKEMTRMIQNEDGNFQDLDLHPTVSSAGEDKPPLRRGATSGATRRDDQESEKGDERPSSSHSSTSSEDISPTGTPRISIEKVDTAKESDMAPSEATFEASGNEVKLSDLKVRPIKQHRRHRPSITGFHILPKGRHKGSDTEEDDNQDFATNHLDRSREQLRQRHGSVTPRSEGELSSRANSTQSLNELDTSGPRRQSRLGSSAAKLLKGGRIGEIIAEEGPPEGPKKKRKGSVPFQRLRKGSSPGSDSDSDSSGILLNQKKNFARSQSATSLSAPSYFTKTLPPFKSINATDARPPTAAKGDEVLRQAQLQRARNKRTQAERLAPPSIDTSDVSPNTSQPDLSRYDTADPGLERSRENSVAPGMNERLNTILKQPGGVGRGGLPMTGLTAFDPKGDGNGSKRGPGQAWNITDEKRARRSHSKSAVSASYKHIAYIRSLLLTSGIKASTIVDRANSVRETPSDFVIKSAVSCGLSLADTPKVPRKEEHVAAARLLSSNLKSTAAAVSKSSDHFKRKTYPTLNDRINNLRQRVQNGLSPRVQDCAGEADLFLTRLTTEHTLSVKQVNDGVDLMIRSRRRRMRWLQKAGFTGLEWFLVGILWWIWGVVFVVKMIKGFIVGVWRVVAWLLFLR